MVELSLVFFGSGPVAEESLRFIEEHFAVEAVVTKPATLSDMKKLTKRPVMSVKNRAELSTLMATKPFKSSLGLVVDFGIIVDQPVIDYFPLGIVNSHFSLLPRWRGADPITFAILKGDQKTGVSLMLIDKTLDTGKLIGQKSLPIAPNDTTPSLTKRLISLSNQLLAEYLPRYARGEITPRAQPHPDRATYSRKFNKSDAQLDFSKSAEVLEREIRAFLGWPGSRMSLAGKDIIITKAHAEPNTGLHHEPGDISVTPKAHEVGVATSNGTLWIERLKPAGKREMSVKEYLAGNKI